MVFKCQENSFLKEFSSKVISCEEAVLKSAERDISGYNVILDDTILFPEGGGQPCDYGEIDGQEVRDVKRKGAEAIHFVITERPFVVGDTVVAKLDWPRRHDHMQQHSGQHLISAIFDKEYTIGTKSWSLGIELSYVELDFEADLTQEKIDHVEKLCNDAIAVATPVRVDVISKDALDTMPDEISRATRGLPDDHVGDIRVITIDGIDSNMCCGTHVTNLAQLQCIKLLHVERLKSRQFLHFLVGNRVLKKLHQCCLREAQLNTVLNGGPPLHVDLAKKLQANQKTMQRTLGKCLKEIAVFEAEKLCQLNEKPQWFSLHRNDGIEQDFINIFLKHSPKIIDSDEHGLALIFLTVSDGTGKGNLLLQGQSNAIADLGPKICELLGGKGCGKGQRYQGKINSVKDLKKCEELIAAYFHA